MNIWKNSNRSLVQATMMTMYWLWKMALGRRVTSTPQESYRLFSTCRFLRMKAHCWNSSVSAIYFSLVVFSPSLRIHSTTVSLRYWSSVICECYC